MTDETTQIHFLHPLEFDRSYEYQVRRQGDLYVAGVNNVELSMGHCHGNVFLDKIVEIEKRIWTPSLRYPFRSGRVKKNIRKNQFEVRGFLTAHNFEYFAERLNDNLKERYGMFMSNQDLELFFRQLYQHYEGLRRL